MDGFKASKLLLKKNTTGGNEYEKVVQRSPYNVAIAALLFMPVILTLPTTLWFCTFSAALCISVEQLVLIIAGFGMHYPFSSLNDIHKMKKKCFGSRNMILHRFWPKPRP